MKRGFFILGAMVGIASSLLPLPVGAEEERTEKERLLKIGEVVVTGTRTAHTLKDVPVETVVISQEEIAKSNATNAMDLLKNIPGVVTNMHDDVMGAYNWRANIRGFNFNDGYGLVLIDGQRAMASGASGAMGEYGVGLNQIPVEMIERIEVVKGPGSALYGSDALAGVINIITKKAPLKPTGKAGVAYGWYTIKERTPVGKPTEYPADKGRSRNQSKNYISYGDTAGNVHYMLNYTYEDSEGVDATPVKSYRHFFLGKMDVDVTDDMLLRFGGELSDYTAETKRDEQTWRYNAALETDITPNQHLSLKGYVYRWDFDHFSAGSTHRFGYVGYTQGEVQYTAHVNDWNVLTLGGELLEQDIDYNLAQKTVNTTSAYLQDEITLLDNLTLVPGVRYDDHSVFGSQVNPKFSLSWKAAEMTTLRTSVGRAFKSPTIRQLYYNEPMLHGTFYIQSNPDLEPEKAVGYSASVEQWLFEERLMASLGYFRNDVDNLVLETDTGATYNGLPLRLYRNVRKALTQGIEAQVQAYVAAGLLVSANYTYTDSEDKDSRKDLTYIPRHSLGGSISYDHKESGFGGKIGADYVGKQYINLDNTQFIGSSTVFDAKIYKALSDKAKVSLEADNIFNSDKGDKAAFRTETTYMVKLETAF